MPFIRAEMISVVSLFRDVTAASAPLHLAAWFSGAELEWLTAD